VTVAVDRSEATTLLRADRGRVLVLSRDSPRVRAHGAVTADRQAVPEGLGRRRWAVGRAHYRRGRDPRGVRRGCVLAARHESWTIAPGGSQSLSAGDDLFVVGESRRARPLRGGGRVIHALAETVGADAAVGVVRPVTAVVAVGFARRPRQGGGHPRRSPSSPSRRGECGAGLPLVLSRGDPRRVTGLLGVAVVALYLNTTSLGSIAAGDSPTSGARDRVLQRGIAGRRSGDGARREIRWRPTCSRCVRTLRSQTARRRVEWRRVVRAVGRFTAVTLPSVGEIGDMDTYDPVSPEKKAELAETLPSSSRGSSRWRTSASGSSPGSKRSTAWATSTSTSAPTGRSVEYFAVGSRAAGLGPTLALDRRRSRWLRIRRTTPPPATRSSCGGTIPSRNTSQPGNYAGSPPTPSPSRSTSRTPNA